MKKTKTKTVYQMEIAECGAACLGIILLYHGKYIPLEQLRTDTGASRDGCNAYSIICGAAKYGLRAEGFRISTERLRQRKMPCIIWWNTDHFVVLESFGRKYVCINDPAKGRRRVTYDVFEEMYSGRALFFEKTEAFTKGQRPDSAAKRLISKISGRKGVVLPFFLLGLFSAVSALLIPVLAGIIMDRVLMGHIYEIGWTFTLIMILSGLISLFLTGYLSFLREKLIRNNSLLSTRNICEHMLKLPISFYEQRYLGDVIGRISDNQMVNEKLVSEIGGLVTGLMISVPGFIILIAYSPVLGLAGLAGLIAELSVTLTGIRYSSIQTERQNPEGRKFGGMLLNGISITETLKTSGLDEEYLDRLDDQMMR